MASLVDGSGSDVPCAGQEAERHLVTQLPHPDAGSGPCERWSWFVNGP